jgi:hypothetical protein
LGNPQYKLERKIRPDRQRGQSWRKMLLNVDGRTGKVT